MSYMLHSTHKHVRTYRGEEVGGLGVEVGGEEDFEEGECRGEVEGDWGGEGWGEGRDKKAVGEGGWEEGDEDGDIQQGVAVAVDRNSCSSKCNSLKPSPGNSNNTMKTYLSDFCLLYSLRGSSLCFVFIV